MKKNKEYIGEVLSLGSEGEGIINCDGVTCFVPFCLEGERVSFRAQKVSGGVAYGRLTEVHTLSADRALPVCPVFEKCGGCQLQHAKYNAQLVFKNKKVQSCLKKLAAIDAFVNDTVPSDEIYGYRNKLVIPVGVNAEGKTAIGFYAPRSHRIVETQECALQRDWSAKLISALSQFIGESGLRGYDGQSGKGDIRHLAAREVEKKLIITVVAARKINLDPLAVILEKEFNNFTLLLNVNKSSGNAVFGKEWHICRGEGYFMGEDEGIKFKAGPNTFLQVNDGVRKKLYRAVLAEVEDKNAVALDLYSGGGMLTAMLAQKCRAAYGVEVVKEAVDCANGLRELNGLQDKMFNICGTVEENIGKVFAMTEGCRRIIVCDPPRKGMERSVVKAILACGAEKLVLISCNPATLARDLGLLCGTLTERDGQLVKNDGSADGGYYGITSVTPFDMFPQTHHVETLVVLSKRASGCEKSNLTE